MIETSRAVYGMVGHPGQRFMNGSFPGQHMAAMPYSHAAIAAAIQTPSHHILAQAAGLSAFNYQQDIYGLLSKQQNSPPVEQSNSSTQSAQSQQHDHPIGYGAFGVVW